MKVTIITATYNSASTIEQTLRSVAAQSYGKIEHIIIDGNSKDNTVGICERFPHVARITSEADTGIYDAMNKGLHQATGDIIAILNSDDFYYDNNVISDIVKAFTCKENPDIIYGNTFAGDFDESGDLIAANRIVRPGKFKKSKFNTGWMPSHVSVYIKKNVYEQYGVFNTNFTIGADYELLLRFMYKELVKTTYLDKMCVCFRIGGVSTSNLKNRILMLEESKEAWKMNNEEMSLLTPYLKLLRGVANLISTKIETLVSKKEKYFRHNEL